MNLTLTVKPEVTPIGAASIFAQFTADEVRSASKDRARMAAFCDLWASLGGPQSINAKGQRVWPSMFSTSHKTTETERLSGRKEYIYYGAPHSAARRWLLADTGDTIRLSFPELHRLLINLCPWSTKGCRAGCLFTAGHGSRTSAKKGRVIRSLVMALDPLGWLAYNHRKLAALNASSLAHPELLNPLVRTEGTTDMALESTPASACLITDHQAIAFANYTKANVSQRPNPDAIPNYQLVRSVWTDSHEITDIVSLWQKGASVACIVDDFEPLRQFDCVFEASTSDQWILNKTPTIGALKLLGDAVSSDAFSGQALADALTAALGS